MTSKPSFIGHRERLRKKFREHGLETFLPHEVLELLLTYAIPRKDTKPIAWALLKKFGSLAAVLDADEKQLCEVDGIGPQTAQFVRLVRGVLKNYSLDRVKKHPVIKSPLQVIQYCKASLADKKEECVEVIFLSIRNTVIGTRIIATGTLDTVLISPRQIIEYALKANASRIILVHNHPSGDTTPSKEDIELTHNLIQAANVFSIKLEDHIIVGKGSCYSLRSNGHI